MTEAIYSCAHSGLPCLGLPQPLETSFHQLGLLRHQWKEQISCSVDEERLCRPKALCTLKALFQQKSIVFWNNDCYRQ